MSTTYDGRAFLKGAGITLGALLGGLGGGAWWFLATFTFDVEGPTRAMRLDAAYGLLGAAALVLVVGLGSWALLRAPGWCVAPVVLVATVLASGAAYQLAV